MLLFNIITTITVSLYAANWIAKKIVNHLNK